MTSALGSACLGAYTFCARQHGQEECDSKGLPLTPNSINVVGRFQSLLELDHPGLCAYLDIKRTRNGEHVISCLCVCVYTHVSLLCLWSHSNVLVPERLLVVLEWYKDCVEDYIKSNQPSE